VAERLADGMADPEMVPRLDSAARDVLADYGRTLRAGYRSDYAATRAAWHALGGQDVARLAAMQTVMACYGGAVEDRDPAWSARALVAFPWADAGRAGDAAKLAEVRRQLALVREVFGNPFRPVSLSPTCRTPLILSLAQAAYEERELPSGHLDPDHLGVLSDALEEAGCSDTELLAHLRSGGFHVRGCWALDLVLGKG
jgi:hypothetical protein